MKPSDLIISILQFALQSVFASLSLDLDRSIEDLKAEREAAAAMLAELSPKTAIQASYAARAVIMYHTSVECFHKAAIPGLSLSLKARFIGHGSALSRHSAQMMKLLAQEKRASEPVPASSGISEMLVRAGEVVRARQAEAAEAAAAAAAEPAAASAHGTAAESVRQDPMSRETAPAKATASAAVSQQLRHPSAPAPRPEPTPETMIQAADREMAKFKATMADTMKALAG